MVSSLVVVVGIVAGMLVPSAHAWTIPRLSTTHRFRTVTSPRHAPRRRRRRRTTTTTTTTTTSMMIANFFGDNNNNNNSNRPPAPKLPRDIADAVRHCRAATQQALTQRLSRLTIEFPVGTKFGVEPGSHSKPTTKKKNTSNSMMMSVTQLSADEYDRSNRELARLLVEMFQPVGSDRITVIFATTDLVQAAQQQWKNDSAGAASTRLMALHPSTATTATSTSLSKKNKKSKAKGFAMKLAQELDDHVDHSHDSSLLLSSTALPASTEVALLVAPPDTPKDRQTIARIAESVGMGTLIILLNARWKTTTTTTAATSKEDDTATAATSAVFEPVFCLSAAPQDAAPRCLLYRAYPGPWIVARKAKLGPPQPILSQATRPTWDDCQAAYQACERGSEGEMGPMESMLDNVAGWFR